MKNFGDLLLGVNIDHVATIRQARGVDYPDPAYAALEAERAGADGITLHVREDRRHVNERDLERILEMCRIPVNLEVAVTSEMLRMIEQYKPPYCCLVPERREEVTTEGGLDVVQHFSAIRDACDQLKSLNIIGSLFIAPCPDQIEAAFETGVPFIELHTGPYSDAKTEHERIEQLERMQKGARLAHQMGLKVNAGHGLHRHNVIPIAKIPEIIELNIGHSIVADAMIEGMYTAVTHMKHILENAR